MKKLAISILMALSVESFAQDFHFVLYNLEPLAVNPASIGINKQMKFVFHHRNQMILPGVNYYTNSFTFSTPLSDKKNTFSVAANIIDDRFQATRNLQNFYAKFALAYKFTIAENKTLSFGIQGNYVNARYDLSQESTGSQYVAQQGYNPNIPNGELSQIFSQNYYSIMPGLQFTKYDNNKLSQYFIGFSSHLPLTRPASIANEKIDILPTYCFNGGATVFHSDLVDISPQALLSYHAGKILATSGVVFSKKFPLQNESKLNLNMGLWISTPKNIAASLELDYKNYGIALGYRQSLDDQSISPGNILELAVTYTPTIKFGRKQSKKIKNKEKSKIVPKSRYALILKPRNPFIKTEKPILSYSFLQKKLLDTIANSKSYIKIDTNSKRDSIIISDTSNVFDIDSSIIYKEQLLVKKLGEPVKYDKGSHLLPIKYYELLDELVMLLKIDDRSKILVIGHTDNTGTDEINMKISAQRAKDIKKYLVAKGIDENRISDIGLGSKKPSFAENTEESRAKNRRAEIVIYR